jgi:hypothetical protein
MTSEEIQSDIEKVRLLRAQTSRWRWGLTGTFVVITVISTGVLWSSAQRLSKDGTPRQQFIDDLSSRMQHDVLPDAIGIGKEAINEINFKDEFGKVNKRAPEVANAAITQVKSLSKDLPEKSMNILNQEFDSVLKDREAKLKADFPQATDDQLSALMTNITSQAHSQVTELAADLFSEHVKTLNGIVSDLGTIEAKEHPSTSDIPTWEMVYVVSDVVRPDFAQLQTQVDEQTRENERAGLKAAKHKI